MSDEFNRQAVEYWKQKAEESHGHAREMYRALLLSKSKILKAEPTNRMIEALGVIGAAIAKHERYHLKNK